MGKYYLQIVILNFKLCGGARGVIVIVAGIGHGHSTSKPRRD